MTHRIERIGDATLILGDCRDILPTLSGVDAVVTDPPYGIGEAAGKNKSRSNLAVARDYGDDAWDNEPCSPEIIAEIRRCSEWQIIFGGNYFQLPPSSCWLVWDKQNGENDFADCELAWTNLQKAVRRIYWRWAGMLRKGSEDRVHPTQKPVGVMEWCLSHLPATVETVLDPFAGSGTTGVACVRRGLRFIGIEREPKYFEIALRRIEEATRQGDLIRDVLPKPQQKAMEL
jgi:DNA modification methylase